MEDTAQTASQNELGTEMTDAELDAFVDKTLGIKPQKVEDKKEDKETKAEKVEETKEDEVEETPKKDTIEAPESPKQDKKDDEAQELAEIADVDTSDLWIEIEGIVVDAEGQQESKKIKITLEDGIPEDVRFKNDKQLYEVLDSMNEMRQIRTDRTAEREKAIEERDNTSRSEEDKAATLARWDDETNDLVEAGLIEKPKSKPADPEKGYTAKEIEADPGLKKIDEVFKFMAKENETRAKDGKKRLASFAAAFSLLVKQETKKADEAKEKAEAEATKKRGALVGGGSSAGGGKKDDYVYKAGSAKSIWAVKTDDL